MQAHKPLVLIVDDERPAVMLLTRILEREGFAVDSAEDGITALEKSRDLLPDLILMDVQMPKLSGFEVTARLREDPATARIPVIFVTAAAREPSDVAHGFQLCADDYIRKPYDHFELLARATSKMRARRLEDRLQRRGEELEALVRIGGEFNQRLGLDELVDLILISAREEFRAEHVELYLLNEQQQLVLYQDVTQGRRSPDSVADLLTRDDTIVGRVFRTGEPIRMGDEADIEPDTTQYLRSLNLSSAMAVPLKHGGRLLGILTVAHQDSGYFSSSNLRLLRSIGEQAALAVRNAQLHAALQSYAQNLEAMVEERTEELRAAHAQLIQTEKLAALGRLAAGIAHEVNNPLQPVLNCLEDAIEDLAHGVEIDPEGLRIAEREVQRIKTIVSRLLDFSRPSTSENDTIDLAVIVQEVLVLTNKQLERMRVRIETHLSTVESFLGSPTQIKQVVLNLMLNAMESMPGGGTITIELYPEGEGAMLTITDTGVGMDQHTIDQIFEPFYSTKGDGTGLGLAVSYGIIQGHGGIIQVTSEPGHGSCFSIWLPYA